MNTRINIKASLDKAPGLFDADTEKFNPHSRFSSWLGINNLTNFATALMRKEYAESITELMKTAIKWTMIATVFMGVYKWTFRGPVYINEAHQRALQQLNGANYPFQGISPDAQSLIDHFFTEHSSFKRWPESGKDYLEQCLASNSQAGTHSTSYFIQKGIENSDFGLINTIIEKCASATSDTQSCMTAEGVLSQSAEAEEFSRKILSSCAKSTNAFCQHARAASIARAVESQDWEQIVKNCIHLNADASCAAALKPLNQKLKDNSKETWELAKKIDHTCRRNNLDLCKVAHAKAIAETAVYGSWPDIIRTIKSQCRDDTQGCSQLVEEASVKLLEEIKRDPSVPDTRTIFWELRYNYYQDNPSKISIALALANACATIPTPNSKQNANQFVNFLEKYTNSLRSSYSFNHHNSYLPYSDNIKDILQPKIAEIKEKIVNLPDMKPNEQTHTDKGGSQQANNHKPQENSCKDMNLAGTMVALLTGRCGMSITNLFLAAAVGKLNF